MKKIELRVVIENRLGLHARAASLLAQHALQFESDIIIRKDGQEFDAKSLMGLLLLAAGKGTELELVISGDDAEEARDALLNLIMERKFDED